MSSYVVGPTRTEVASAALAQFRVCKLDGSNKLEYADAGDESLALGVTVKANFAAEDVVALHLLNSQGTFPGTASGAIAKGAECALDDDGKVKSVNAGGIFRARSVATADGDYIELQVIPQNDSTAKTIADPGDAGAIPVNGSGNVELVTGGAETRTLADPTKNGLQLVLSLKTDGGDCVITAATKVNQTGNTIMTLADAGDSATLVSVPDGAGFRWSIQGNDGVALS